MNLLDLAKKMYWADENNDGKNDKYDYGLGGTGSTDFEKNAPDGTPGKGTLDIDCSHLVNNVVREAGYSLPKGNISTTSMAGSGYYDVVPKNSSNIKPGDIIYFDPPPGGKYGHVGIVVEYDPATGKGKFFGSQSSTGPAVVDFGPDAPYWGNKRPVGKFLRPKSEYGPTGTKGFLDSLMDKVMGWAKSLFATAIRTVAIRRDPLILDLDGDSVIKTLGTDAGIHFDHDGNSFKELSGWAGYGDGMLMLDRNINGALDNGSELFGDFTPLSNGMLAVNGFQALG